MSNKYVGTNKGSTTVGANFNATATAFTVGTGEGVRLPAPTGGDYTLLVLQNTAGVREIICVVGRTGDVCTVGIPGSAAANVAGRNYEAIYGMAAASWVIGDVVSCRPTAELIEAGVNFGASIAAAANKATPVDADTLALSDSAAAGASSKLTWANLKATLKAYFDTLYLALAGGTLTGDLTMGAGAKIVFEGTTADDFETTLTVVDPTADRVVTFPNATGTVALMSDVTAAVAGAVIPGMIIDFGGSAAPTGYLACNGAAVSRATYAALFTAVGTLWGAGDGSTTFNVPNFPTGFVAVQGGTVGGTTAGQMPAHTHDYYGANAHNVSAPAGGTPLTQNYAATTTSAGSGTNNLAAGMYVLKCIKT